MVGRAAKGRSADADLLSLQVLGGLRRALVVLAVVVGEVVLLVFGPVWVGTNCVIISVRARSTGEAVLCERRKVADDIPEIANVTSAFVDGEQNRRDLAIVFVPEGRGVARGGWVRADEGEIFSSVDAIVTILDENLDFLRPVAFVVARNDHAGHTLVFRRADPDSFARSTFSARCAFFGDRGFDDEAKNSQKERENLERGKHPVLR